MRRPGFLSDIEGFSGYGEAPSYANLGGFGKGYMAPPPAAPGPADFRDGAWVCPGAKPAGDAKGYYHCCPSGWKKVAFGEPYPCKGAEGDMSDEDLLSCGPMPSGDVICCPSMARWANRPPSGENPCPGARQATAINLTPGDILSDPLMMDLREQPLVTPGLMIAIGGAAMVGLGLFVVMSMSKKPKAVAVRR